MSNRSAKFAAALAVSLLAGANFGAVAQNAAAPAATDTANTKTADACQSAPKGIAPAGSHWFYRRKMLRQSLKSLSVDPARLAAAAGIDATRRAETIPVTGFVAMARELADIRSTK